MSLSPTQIQAFRTDGYVKVDPFFSARETRAIRLEVERLKADGKLRNVVPTDEQGGAKGGLVNLQLCPIYRESDFFRALPFAPKVIEAVSSLIGDPVILHLDQVFLKPGRSGAGTNWHQDNAYFKVADPLRGTAMWIAVHDATVANGTMAVIPGVFRESFEHAKDPMSDHHIRMYPDAAQEQAAVPIELKAGGVVFFCYGTPHCTGANGTDHERAGVALHFLHESVAETSPQRGALLKEDRTYHPYLSGARSTGGQREYGERIAGTWDAHVSRVLGAVVPVA